jgi:hypothetical protein
MSSKAFAVRPKAKIRILDVDWWTQVTYVSLLCLRPSFDGQVNWKTFGVSVCVRGIFYALLGVDRLHGAFSMCVFMSDKPFVAEVCPPMSHASASNG